MLGEVGSDEIAEYAENYADKPNFNTAFQSALRGISGVGFWSTMGAAGWATMATLSRFIKKPVMWAVLPGFAWYLFSLKLKYREQRLRMGEVVDFTVWCAEKRKAEVWYQQNKGKYAMIGDFNMAGVIAQGVALAQR
jgi:hypothetical protein